MDLMGTARTLDGCDGIMKLSDDAYGKGNAPMNEKYAGKVPMEHGILSRNGFSVVDDSHSMALTEDDRVLVKICISSDMLIVIWIV